MPKYQLLPGNQILERYYKNLNTLRSGRVNASILDTIKVNAYGTELSIKEVATINSLEPAQLLITPFDKGLIPAITKAITDSTLSINPVDDGAGVRLSFPSLTEEDRKNRVKDLHKLQEEARKDLRIHRQDVLKHKKKAKEDGEISEDEFKVFEKNLQKEVDDINFEIENITQNKEKEIMKV